MRKSVNKALNSLQSLDSMEWLREILLSDPEKAHYFKKWLQHSLNEDEIDELFMKYLMAFRLSKTEIKVAMFISEGRSNKAAADKFFVAEKTIRWHLTIIYKKLNLKNRAGLIYLRYNMKPMDKLINMDNLVSL